MPKQFLMINKQFLQDQNFEQAHQNSIVLNKKFGELCDLLKRTFQSLADNKITVDDNNIGVGFKEGKKEFKFLQELKRFIKVFTQITKEMSTYQITCFENHKDNNIPSLDITYQILHRVRQNRDLTITIEENRINLVHLHASIKNKYGQFERKMRHPVLLYQPSLVKEQISQIEDVVNSSLKIMNQCENQRQKIQLKIEEFQPYLSTFRKKLVKNKYVILKKLIFLIKNTKNATIQIFDALKTCAIKKREEYLKVIEDKTDNVTYLTDYLGRKMNQSNFEHHIQENKKWQKYTSNTIKQLQETFDQIEYLINQLVAYFNQFVNLCNQQHQMFRKIAIQINEFYQDQESPYPMMKQLLDIQIYFNTKFNHIVLKLQQINNKVRYEKKYCKKQSQILLTIIKVNRTNFKSTLQNIGKDKELIQLIERISFESTKKVLLSLYMQFISLQSELLEKFDSEVHKKKKIYNSMEISHTVRQLKIAQKKIPLKTEYWLWKDWTSQIQINFEYYKNYYQQITKFIEQVKKDTQVKDSTQLQMYNCTFMDRKNQQNGILAVKINSLQFSSQELNLVVPWKQIDKIAKQDKMFKQFLVIGTHKGQLRFKQILALNSVVQSLKQAHQKGLMGNRKKLDRKPEVILSEYELIQIQKRRQFIQPKIQDTSEFLLLVQHTFQRVRIDELYYIFYSDIPFNFYGRQEPNFLIYLGKKSGNHEYTYEKYNKPGPTFYTMQPDISFKDCPIYSSRKTTLIHPMKPSPIPFMPKTCINQFEQRLYWISHEEFMIVNESITKGVPYCDTFRVFVVNHLRKRGDGVHLQVKLWVKWIENTIMKGQVYGSIEPEIKQNGQSLVKQIEKVLRLMQSMENGQQVEIQSQKTFQGVQKQSPNELTRLKKYNQYLVYGIIGIIIANILFLIIF